MDLASEIEFERKAEKMLRGHRELPPGRSYRAFYERYRTDVSNPGFDRRYDETFPDAPGAPGWIDGNYCRVCEKRLAWCDC